MKLSHKYTVVVLVAMLFSSLLLGCAANGKEEEPGFSSIVEGEPIEVTISLSSRSMISSGTRADGKPANPDHENEMIKDWFLVFVNRHGVVSKILERKNANPSATPPFEEETFKCIIPSGTYSVYAFANMTQVELKAASGVEFEEGETLTDEQLKAIQGSEWTEELNLWDIEKKAIPMTGYLSAVKIQNKVEESFSIEVVRMLAKVDFWITNTTTNQIEVVSVGLDPVTKSNVSLFPTGKTGISYSHLGLEAYTPLDNAEYFRLMYNAGLKIPAKPIGESDSKKNVERCRFYFKESLSHRNNGGLFTVWLDVKHNDGERSTQQFNVTNDIRDYINRNDWLVIPIELSKYAVRVDAFFYPPIGGYPAYLSSTDPDGSQVFTFGTQGEFCIVPQVIDKETGEHLSPSLYKFEIFSIEDTDEKIFSKQPYISQTAPSLPDEILGTLNTNEGHASVKIKVMVKDSPVDTEWSQTYLRTIHIVRDNNAVPDNNTTD